MSEQPADVSTSSTGKPKNWLNLPVEVAASLLAVTTVLIGLGALHLPTWAIFIGWAGTFAMGGPTAANMKRIWTVMPIGSCAGFLVVLANQQASELFTGNAFIAAEVVILFCINGAMISLTRVSSAFDFVPGMFFGFATFFATFFGAFGPDSTSPGAALLAAIVMNALGPIYAWLNLKLAAPHGH